MSDQIHMLPVPEGLSRVTMREHLDREKLFWQNLAETFGITYAQLLADYEATNYSIARKYMSPAPNNEVGT